MWVLPSGELGGLVPVCPPLTPAPRSCSGEVSWACLRAQLSSLTYSSWAYLQNTTLAVTNWASAMISGH